MADRFIGVRVPAELKKRLQDEASEKGVSLSEHLRCYLATDWASSTQATKREQEARWSGAEPPVSYETQREKASKARVQKAVENEEPVEVEVQAGTTLPREGLSPDEIRAKAKALVASKGLRYQVAYAQVLKEEAKAS